MAYNSENLVKLGQLKALAQEVNNTFATKESVTELSGRVDGLVTAGGEPNKLEGVMVNGAALMIAEKMVDILIASGTANGSISVNGVDVMVKGLAALAYKANVSESDLDAALKAVIDAKAAASDVTVLSGKVATLIGADSGKSARTIANEELAAQLIPENAKESLDTLAELAAWIQSHPDDASKMNAAITALQNLVGALPEGATSTTVVAYIQEAIDKAAYKHPSYTPYASGLYKVTVDASGHVSAATAATKADITALGIPGQDTTYGAATATAAGLMPAADKAKLDGMSIATDAEVTEMLTEVFA